MAHPLAKRLHRVWSRHHGLPTLQAAVTLHIPPHEQYFLSMYYAPCCWSDAKIRLFIDKLGYEPDDDNHDNFIWLRDMIAEIFDVTDLGDNRFLVDGDIVEEFINL